MDDDHSREKGDALNSKFDQNIVTASDLKAFLTEKSETIFSLPKCFQKLFLRLRKPDALNRAG